MKKNPKYIGISSYTVGIKVSRIIAKTNKEIAKKRHEFMELYLEQFYKEWHGEA